jgi:hypothetical protein
VAFGLLLLVLLDPVLVLFCLLHPPQSEVDSRWKPVNRTARLRVFGGSQSKHAFGRSGSAVEIALTLQEPSLGEDGRDEIGRPRQQECDGAFGLVVSALVDQEIDVAVERGGIDFRQTFRNGPSPAEGLVGKRRAG